MRSLFFTPSASDRWTTCTASVRAVAEARENGVIPAEAPSTEEADEGTEAHAVAASALLMGEMPDIPDPVLAFAVEGYFSTVQSFVRPGDDLLVEERIPLFYEPDAMGTTDVAVLGKDRFVVGDLKYGAGINVEAVGNTQLLIYAINVFHKFHKRYKWTDETPVTLFIFQPRAVGGREYREWTMTVGELLKRGLEISRLVTALRKDSPGEFRPSAKACRWCPLKAECARRGRSVTEPLDVIVDEPLYRQLRLPDTGTLTVEQMAQVLDASEAIASWLNGIAAAVRARLLRGEPVPGFKLVTGKGNRAWTDETEATEALVTHLEDAAFKPRELIGVADAEKLLRKHFGRKDKDTADMVLSLLVHRPEAAPRVVKDNHEQPGIDVFDGLPE